MLQFNDTALPALIADCAALLYEPKEIKNLDFRDEKIPYDWNLEHG